MARRSSSTPARPSRSWSCWGSKADPTPGTSWPRCCGPSRTTNRARSALRRTLSVLRSALGGRWVVVGPIGRRPRRRRRPRRSRGARGRRRVGRPRGPAPGGRRWRAVRSWPGSRSATAPDFDDWRATRAVAVERLVGDVLERLATTAEAEGDTVRRDRPPRLAGSTSIPLDEPARRQLMALLARAGDRAGAIRQYRAGVAVLERELGVAPLAETTDLYEAIRDAQLPAAAATTGPRSRRRRRSTSRQRLQPRTSRPCRAPARLPIVGRDAELAALVAAHHAAIVCAAASPCSAARRGSASRGWRRRSPSGLGLGRPRPRGPRLRGRGHDRVRTDRRAAPRRLRRPGARAAALAGLTPPTLREIERLVPCHRRSPATSLPHRRTPAATTSPPRGRGSWTRSRRCSWPLVAGDVPGLVVVEDLQWADDASREALAVPRPAARRTPGAASC